MCNNMLWTADIFAAALMATHRLRQATRCHLTNNGINKQNAVELSTWLSINTIKMLHVIVCKSRVHFIGANKINACTLKQHDQCHFSIKLVPSPPCGATVIAQYTECLYGMIREPDYLSIGYLGKCLHKSTMQHQTATGCSITFGEQYIHHPNVK